MEKEDSTVCFEGKRDEGDEPVDEVRWVRTCHVLEMNPFVYLSMSCFHIPLGAARSTHVSSGQCEAVVSVSK